MNMLQTKDATIGSHARSAMIGLSVLIMAWVSPAPAGAQQSCRADGQLMNVKDLPEASGVAASRRTPGVLWSHNDSGEPFLVAVAMDGTTRGRTRVPGVTVVDWEDIDVGPCPGGSCVYIADIGDNSGKRRSVTIYRVPEPEPGAATAPNAESMQVSYPDRAQDAEALFVLPNGTMFIVTKGEQGPAALYRAPGTFRNGATAKLERIATIVTGSQKGPVARANRITGAAASPDGRWIALRSLSMLTFYSAADLGTGKVREAFRYDVTGVGEAQGEGITFGTGDTVWLASEGGGKSRAGTIAKLTCALN